MKAAVDTSYGRIPVTFPAVPYPSRHRFGAYITSYMPAGNDHRRDRQHNLARQLRWWRLMTDIPITVLTSNWNEQEIERFDEFGFLAGHGGCVIRRAARPLILNRIDCLTEFYRSDHDWGIMMDDDAILYDSPEHNSGAAFFAEMAANNSDDYAEVDVFFPINPAKIGFRPVWQNDPGLYASHHVFGRNYDLKGSLFVVRNFRKAGRPEVLPPAEFQLHGEDTLFALEAIAQKCTVLRCDNIVLHELKGPSHFLNRKQEMKRGNEELVKRYEGLGLRMSAKRGSEHLLDRSDFLARAGRRQPRLVAIPKPSPAISRPF